MRSSICRELAWRVVGGRSLYDLRLRQYSADQAAQLQPEEPSSSQQPEIDPAAAAEVPSAGLTAAASEISSAGLKKKKFHWHSVTYDEASKAMAASALSATLKKPSEPGRIKVSYLSDPENSGKGTSGINFDTLGSWNNRLQLKIDMDESIKRGTIVPKIDLSSVGKNTLIGRRPTNEDRILCMELKPNLLLFGIMDGHGGSAAVDHVHEQLPKHILHLLDKGETRLDEVLTKSFLEVNQSFTKLHQQANKGENSSGTTATVCLLRDGVELTVAHVGDSRAILCRNNNAARLTVDHLPSEQSEANRIIQCKGHLTWSSLGRSRVNGRLEMTRSIGDVELKPFGVIADPDITKVKIKNGSDSFLALTTDGIHSRLNTSEIVQLTASCSSPQEAAEFLTDQALLFGSEDNCSILVIPFGAWGKFTEAVRQVHFSRSRNPGIGWHG